MRSGRELRRGGGGHRPALGLDVGRRALEEHVHVVTVPEHRGRAEQRARRRRWSGTTAPTPPGTAAECRLDEQPERAERADEEPRQVVSGDVLHRRSPTLDDASVRGDEVHFEDLLA